MSYPWCVMHMPKIQGRAKGAILADARWPIDSIVKFAFLDGDEKLQDRVADVAQEWISRTGARLTLERNKDPSRADIRISFRLKGSWSMIGRYCRLKTNPKEATMNYGWLHVDSSDADVREVVLHEFGHALGFIHEHQNPAGGMQWNRQEVIEALSGPPNNWSVEEIEFNVLDQYDPRELIGTPFDPDSIMLYPFPAEWTQNGVSTKNNGDLSAKDIQLVKRVYT